MKKFSMKDLVDRLLWTLVGYGASIFGIVNLPRPPEAF